MKIGIIGCAGRMGRTLLRKTLEKPESYTLQGGVENTDADTIGVDLGILAGMPNCGIIATENLEELIVNSDTVINFTRPGATLTAAKLAAAHNTSHIIGTTGMNDAETAQLAEYAKNNVTVHSHNMSLGINLLLNLVEQVSQNLNETDFDIEIEEMHHRHKLDAPSGTAISLGDAAANGREEQTGNRPALKLSREGADDPRTQGEIGFATLRGGNVVGEHSVIFASDEERIVISHKAESRDIFAAGALRAALWTKDKPAGLYSMRDVIGLD